LHALLHGQEEEEGEQDDDLHIAHACCEGGSDGRQLGVSGREAWRTGANGEGGKGEAAGVVRLDVIALEVDGVGGLMAVEGLVVRIGDRAVAVDVGGEARGLRLFEDLALTSRVEGGTADVKVRLMAPARVELAAGV
jgi:hypothetical protein